MADLPPLDDCRSPEDPESLFLIELWDRLDRAADISTASTVIAHLDEVVALCEEAAGLIRRWKSQGA